MFQRAVKPMLFRLSQRDPEIAHELIMHPLSLASHLPPALALIDALYGYRDARLSRDVFGLRFPNPVGLSGGFDKNGRALAALAAMGFGFIEAGGVTKLPQPGQERPRIFRLNADEGLINRMGLPNEGADIIAARLATQSKPGIPIGWQIAKSKATPIEEAIDDYLYSLRKLYTFADYFTLNVSSPNTPGLRQLQEREPLAALVHAVVTESQRLAHGTRIPPKPILIKMSPDLSWSAIDDVIAVALDNGASGLVATNTTTSREGLRTPIDEAGGMSGKPIATRALEVVRYLCQELQGRLPVIGVGGIFGPDDAKRMLDAGAALIQIYTGFIYEGPGVVRRINRALAASGVAVAQAQEATR